LVAALATKLHSPFRGRKPRRREDHGKRTSRSETLDVVLASTLHSPSRGRKPWRRETCCWGTWTAEERDQELVNPASD
jgi:hypothetical protein